jgi:hypothetical protein
MWICTAIAGEFEAHTPPLKSSLTRFSSLLESYC